MKLLLVSPKMEKPNGGIAVWTDMYLDGCIATEIEPTVLNTAPIGRRAENGSANRSLTDEIGRTRAIFKSLNKLLRDERFDVVHLNSSCGTFGVIRDYLTAKRIRKKQPNAKIAVHYHCDIPIQIGNKVSKYFLSRLVALSDLNFVLCENSKRYLEQAFSAQSVKVPNFVSSEMVIAGERKINPRLSRAFFVGRVSAAKGSGEIYELARLNPQITFSLAGAISDDVASVPKPSNVELLGPISHSDVIKMMDEADVFIFPSHTEGFSMALAEAMARGLPAIATDVGANADMLENSGGIICPVSDVSALNDAISLLREEETRTAMSRWCIDKVRACYLSDKVISLFSEHYVGLMERE